MQFIKQIYRDDQSVKIEINSNLGTCQPVYPFEWVCENQEEAELLSRHLDGVFDDYRIQVVKNYMSYLTPEEISILKMDLVKHWDAKNHSWK